MQADPVIHWRMTTAIKALYYMYAEMAISWLNFNVWHTAIVRQMFTNKHINKMSVLHCPVARRVQLRASGFIGALYM